MLKGLAPAGRLDIDSTGLLVLTQDGRIARSLIGEDSDVEKEYLVRVEGEVTPEGLALLNHGLSLDDRALRPARVKQLNPDQLHFLLKEGRKRQIRRMVRYRIEVGRNQGATPKDIVGAIANEANIQSRYIGHIALFDDYSTVELPESLPKDVLHVLHDVEVRQSPLLIHRLDGESVVVPAKPQRQPRRWGNTNNQEVGYVNQEQRLQAHGAGLAGQLGNAGRHLAPAGGMDDIRQQFQADQFPRRIGVEQGGGGGIGEHHPAVLMQEHGGGGVEHQFPVEVFAFRQLGLLAFSQADVAAQLAQQAENQQAGGEPYPHVPAHLMAPVVQLGAAVDTHPQHQTEIGEGMKMGEDRARVHRAAVGQGEKVGQPGAAAFRRTSQAAAIIPVKGPGAFPIGADGGEIAVQAGDFHPGPDDA